MEVKTKKYIQNSEWLTWCAVGVLLSFFLANYYVMATTYLLDQMHSPAALKTLNLVFSTPVFMVGTILIATIATGKMDKLLKVLRLRKWRYYYIPEGIGLQMIFFFPLAVISYMTLIIVNKLLQPIFPTAVKFLTQTSKAVQSFALNSDWHSFAIFAFAAVVVAPVVEELVFRGVVFSFFKKHTGTAVAVTGTSFFFAAFHLNILQFVPLFMLGVLFQLLFIYHKSIFPCMIYHSANNLFAIICLMLVKLKIIDMAI